MLSGCPIRLLGWERRGEGGQGWRASVNDTKLAKRRIRQLCWNFVVDETSSGVCQRGCETCAGSSRRQSWSFRERKGAAETARSRIWRYDALDTNNIMTRTAQISKSTSAIMPLGSLWSLRGVNGVPGKNNKPSDPFRAKLYPPAVRLLYRSCPPTIVHLADRSPRVRVCCVDANINPFQAEQTTS